MGNPVIDDAVSRAGGVMSNIVSLAITVIVIALLLVGGLAFWIIKSNRKGGKK